MLKNDRINIVIALLIAIGMWVYVVGVENPEKETTLKDIPITFLNEDTLADEGLTLLSVSDNSVDVKVSGVRNEIKHVKKSDIKIYVDLEGYKEGQHTVRLQIGKVDKVEIESKTKISVVIDRLVTEEKPVAISMDGHVSDETEPYVVQVSPHAVEVTGAKTLIDSIVKLDAALDIAKVDTQLKSFTVPLKPLNAAGDTVGNVRLAATSVSVSAVNLSKKTVHLEVPVDGYDADNVERTVTVPKTITIKGMDADLQEISSVTAERIDISEIYENTALRIVPILPSGVEVAANSQNLKARIEIKGMVSRSFEYGKDAVIVEGLEEDMTVAVSDIDIKLSVIGQEDAVLALTGEEFAFFADVRDLQPGTHEVVVNCRYNVNLNVVKFTPEVITLLIEEAGASQVGTDAEGEVQDGSAAEESTAAAGAQPDSETEAAGGTSTEETAGSAPQA